jgi:putative SOS response-associated peptidase YedK
MGGRARLSSDVSEIKIAFGMPPERPTPHFAASWNVAPTDPLPIVRYDVKDHRRSRQVMRWGAWCRSESRTSRPASPTSTPRPKEYGVFCPTPLMPCAA